MSQAFGLQILEDRNDKGWSNFEFNGFGTDSIDLNLEPEVIIIENDRKTSADVCVTISTNFISNRHAFVHHTSQFLQSKLLTERVKSI